MSGRLVGALASAAALSGLLVASCGSGEEAAPAGRARASGATTSRAANPLPFLGTYARTVTRGDIERSAGIRHERPGQEPPRPGPATLVVSRDSLTYVDPTAQPAFSITQDATATAGGRLTID